MTQVREICFKIFTWSMFSQEKQLNFNGYYLVRKQESVLIDPPGLNKDGLTELGDLISKHSDAPLKSILLTNAHHDRMSQELKKMFSIPIFINEDDKELMEFEPDRTFRDGQELFCGLTAIQFDGQKSPGETGFLIKKEKILFVGDALIGKVKGTVDLLAKEKYKDINQAKEGLKKIKNLNFETLLVGDGESILGNAKSKVIDFLEG